MTMSEASGQARLTQWMLDVGVPPKEVFDVLVPSVGVARTAQVVELLKPPGDATARRPGTRRRRVA
jgi:hypothetical protein